MGGLMIFMSILLALYSLNGHEDGAPLSQVEWVQIGFAALLLICGSVIYFVRGDN